MRKPRLCVRFFASSRLKWKGLMFQSGFCCESTFSSVFQCCVIYKIGLYSSIHLYSKNNHIFLYMAYLKFIRIRLCVTKSVSLSPIERSILEYILCLEMRVVKLFADRNIPHFHITMPEGPSLQLLLSLFINRKHRRGLFRNREMFSSIFSVPFILFLFCTL